jgi:catechol 2,3-dioxygenase-like lactoylglutathione lyase family enzyme
MGKKLKIRTVSRQLPDAHSKQTDGASPLSSIAATGRRLLMNISRLSNEGRKMMIHRIHHTSFTVSNMERSIAFYRDILGMKVTWDSAAAGVRFKGPVADNVTGCPGTEQRLVFLAVGESRIELVEYMPKGRPQVDNKASDTGSTHACFMTDDINELHRKLVANHVRLHCVPQELDFAKVMYFRDPDGIILEAAQGQLPG